jgi:hypothetical protein
MAPQLGIEEIKHGLELSSLGKPRKARMDNVFTLQVSRRLISAAINEDLGNLGSTKSAGNHQGSFSVRGLLLKVFRTICHKILKQFR